MAKFKQIWAILVQNETGESFARKGLFYISLVGLALQAIIAIKLQMAGADSFMHFVAAAASAGIAFFCLANSTQDDETFKGLWIIPAVIILALTVWVVPAVYFSAVVLNALLHISHARFKPMATA